MKNLFLILVLGIFLSNFVFAESLLGNGSAQVTFSGGVGCYSKSNLAYWIVSSNETVFNSTGNVGNCSKYWDSSISNSGLCCPTGYDCSISSGKCLPKTRSECSQYNNSVDCNSDPSLVAVSSFNSLHPTLIGVCNNQTSYNLNQDTSCVNVSICSCLWNKANSKCESAINASSICEGLSDITESCSWAESGTENLCDSQGKVVIRYSASGNSVGKIMSNGVNCSNIQVDYPCSASVKLPFFNGFNFIVAVLLIAGVYFVSSRRH